MVVGPVGVVPTAVPAQEPPWRERRWRRTVVPLAVAVAGLVAILLRTELREPAEPQGFVTRSGTQLLVDGEPYRFLGYNNYVMLGCGHPEERLDAEARDVFFAGLREGSVVRLHLFPGTPLDTFDSVVESAREHGQRLMPVLTDALGGCGDTKKDDDWYRGGFRDEYLAWVNEVVPRYADEPVIAMWELINEPHGDDLEAIRGFFDEAGAVVKALAPRHLVSSGTLQPATYGGADGFAYLSASDSISVLSLHEYDEVPGVSPHLESARDVAVDLDKPLVVGEWGIMASPNGQSGDKTCFTLHQRQALASQKLTGYMSDPVVAGALYWSYMANQDHECRLSVAPGDPLLDLIHDLEIPIEGEPKS